MVDAGKWLATRVVHFAVNSCPIATFPPESPSLLGPLTILHTPQMFTIPRESFPKKKIRGGAYIVWEKVDQYRVVPQKDCVDQAVNETIS